MAKNIRSLISVGIDIGTSTTQLVFSRLTLDGGTRQSNHPRPAAIVDKTVLYRSDVHFTPLVSDDTVDAPALEAILRAEYAHAGISPAEVDTGAAIITGETAKKKNADAVLTAVSALAGDFVVTVAGPHLESMISGRGSGAAAYSREHFCTVTNIDIGGGSANSAVFRQGELLATAAMNFGGRILQLDSDSGRVTRIAEPARHILQAIQSPIEIDEHPTLAELRRFTDAMADLTIHLMHGTSDALAEKLMLTPPTPVPADGTVLFFSGGIGQVFYRPALLNTVADVAIHGDVGPLLAQSLREHPALASFTIRQPQETMRATVLGASSQTVSLSGSTIWVDDDTLPLRNVPVVRPRWGGAPLSAGMVAGAMTQAVTRWDVSPGAGNFAVAVEIVWQMDYNSLTELGRGLADFAEAHLPARQPFIIITDNDYARALGQTLKSLLPGGRPLLVIDQVGLREGDFVDIGRPLLDGRVVPLSVKTLVFYG